MFNGKLFEGMEVFVAVVESGSFTAAAERSGHSTSYISKEITKLEERLGVRLLQRTTRRLSLTPEGESYFEQSKLLVEAASDAFDSVSGNQSEPQGILRVTCPVGLAQTKLQPWLAEFSLTYPKVHLELDLNDKKVDIIEQGFDVGIRASDRLEDSTLISRKLSQWHGVTIASPAYLKQFGMPSSFEELAQHRVMTYSNAKSPNKWQYTDQNGGEREVVVKAQMSSNSGGMSLAMCKAGLGIARIPSFYLTDELQNGELVELFSDLPKNQLGLYVVYPSRKHMTAKVRAFIDFLADKSQLT